jgi:hypothetical protein
MRLFSAAAVVWLALGTSVSAGEEMPGMPIVHPKREFVLQPGQGEALRAQRGFGLDAPMINMMNLMMVEGSGYEGMDMNMHGPGPAPSARPPQ